MTSATISFIFAEEYSSQGIEKDKSLTDFCFIESQLQTKAK